MIERPESVPYIAFVIFHTVLVEKFSVFVLKRHLFVVFLLMVDDMGFLFRLPFRRSEWNPCRVHFLGIQNPRLAGSTVSNPPTWG